MTDERSALPDAEACLRQRPPSSPRGGTIIVACVMTLAQHNERILEPEGYRPDRCRNCEHTRLHGHGIRSRLLPGGSVGSVDVRRYICVNPHCRATWMMLPAFVPPRLHRTWRAVEEAVLPRTEDVQPSAPKRTVRRWKASLRFAMAWLLELLAASKDAVLTTVTANVGQDASFRDLVGAVATARKLRSGERLSTLAALVDRYAPGSRLM